LTWKTTLFEDDFDSTTNYSIILHFLLVAVRGNILLGFVKTH
jgi:hypothetical protein